jgi:hypothetical protein
MNFSNISCCTCCLQSYFWIDQCDSPINKVLTLLAYAHVCYQVGAAVVDQQYSWYGGCQLPGQLLQQLEWSLCRTALC